MRASCPSTRASVGHVWLVEPLAHTLEILRREGERWLLISVFSDDVPVRCEPFEAIDLPLGALWADEKVAQVQVGAAER